MTEDATWKLRPSDFAFLWDECKRCFYLMVKEGFARPGAPMPKIFTKIDNEMKNFYRDKPTREVIPEMPAGRFVYEDRMVRSTPLEIGGGPSPAYIQGKFDSVIRLDDGTYGVVDFKTSERKPDHLSIYGRQLHAYAYALEHPETGYRLDVGPITTLGLIVYEPHLYRHDGEGLPVLHGHLSWVQIKRDDAKFTAFLGEVIRVLRGGLPDPASSCAWCRYRKLSRSLNLEDDQLTLCGFRPASE